MVMARAVRWVAALAVVVAVALAGYWAGQRTLAGPAGQVGEQASVVQTVAEATVGRTLSLNVTVEQPFVPVAVNALAGTVTWVRSGEEVVAGDVLYEVDTVPVRVVAGEVPFWRVLTSPASGEDVAQLQRALSELGLYRGQVDGRFGLSTVEAVRLWQRDAGVAVTGMVGLGELVAVPALPARLRLGEEIVLGARLGGGEPAVFAPTRELRFSLVVSPDQAALIPLGASVMVAHEGYTWQAVVGEATTDQAGEIRYLLTAPGGGMVCGEECATLPASEHTTLRAQVVVVPQVSGPAVPVAAVHTDPDGTAWVEMADGSRREVTVRASAGGLAVVSGIEPGERVRVFGDGPGGGPVAPGPGEGGGAGAGR